MAHHLPLIAVTPGEPAGIGPDLTVQLAQQAHDVALVVIADPELLAQRAEMLGLPLELEQYAPDAAPAPQQPGRLTVLPCKMARPVHCGQPESANAPYILESLSRAVAGCLQGRFQALVTGPVHKGIINEAGIPFSGHTEFLAAETGTDQVVMMLATPGLRVALATTHLPLRAVPDAITQPLLEQVLRILVQDLQRKLGIPKPRLLVCGLNPHAGEGGHLGSEDQAVIAPVLERLREEGMQLLGPLPADTLFVPKYLEQADAVLAMYHDQGLPVLKHMGFGRACNITLGLPIIRTSVDHGTALELAGSGRADPGSLETALAVAIEMVQRSQVHL